jgi:DNA-binding CsgD family transcriptional regulator
MIKPLIDRFMDKVSPEPMSGCWLWTGSVNRAGYGMFHVRHDAARNRSHAALAHRVSFEVFKGQELGQLQALHHCDNPACVNPAHLFAGRPADNVADMDGKGRRVNRPMRGSRHANSKVTETDVLQMFALRLQGLTQQQIGNRFGISQVQVGNILRKNQWKQVQPGDMQ